MQTVTDRTEAEWGGRRSAEDGSIHSQRMLLVWSDIWQINRERREVSPLAGWDSGMGLQLTLCTQAHTIQEQQELFCVPYTSPLLLTDTIQNFLTLLHPTQCCGCWYNIQVEWICTGSFDSELQINPAKQWDTTRAGLGIFKNGLASPRQGCCGKYLPYPQKIISAFNDKLVRITTLKQSFLWAQGTRETQWTSEENDLPAFSCSSSKVTKLWPVIYSGDLTARW